MATVNRLIRLFKAVAARDWVTAEAVAQEVAQAEEQTGHHTAAQRLRGALRSNGRTSDPGYPSERQHSVQFLTDALTAVPADRALADIYLKRGTRVVLEEVIAEWLNRKLLELKGLPRRSKLLFHGPPGCGKSVTARALGHELRMPVYVVRFDAVVGAYLGQTALHLRQLFRFAEATPSILLVDEIDALGKRRGSPLDVGELDRVVIALLQELEHSQPAGFLIATSNLARHLDDALWRRFDLVVEFPPPSRGELKSFVTSRARARSMRFSPHLKAALGKLRTFADAERLLEAEERRLVLRR